MAGGVQIGVCINSSCSASGGGLLIRDLEELAQGRCSVEEQGCLGRCGKGPNIQIKMRSGVYKVVEGVKTYKKAFEIIKEKAELDVPDAVGKLAKIKYDVRREGDATARMEKLGKAFDVIGGETKGAQSNPRGLSELLVLRSKELLKEHVERALQDAQLAVELAADWAQAQLALGNALEMSTRPGEAMKALQTALEINKGINAFAVKRQIKRLERKAQDQAANPTEPPPPLPAPATAPEPEKASASKPAAAKSSAKKKAAPKAKSASKDGAKGSKEGAAAKQPAKKTAGNKTEKKPVQQEPVQESKVEDNDADEEGPPDFVEWRLEENSVMNHNCFKMVFKSTNVKATSKHPVTEVWHVDFLKELDFGEELKRSYTPVSDADAYRKGMLEFMIKVYPDGKMTPWLQTMKPGTKLLISPPHPTLDPRDYGDTVMVAGGTAVTIALQFCRAIHDLKPEASIWLAMCNRTQEDVLYQNLFDDLLSRFSSFRMVHCISSGKAVAKDAKQGSAGSHPGRVTSDVFFAQAPKDAKAIVSGPMGLCQTVVDIWQEQKRSLMDLSVLDELPMPAEASEMDTARSASGTARSAPGTARSAPLLEELKEPSNTESAVAAQVAMEAAPAPCSKPIEPMAVPTTNMASLFCSVLSPFWCQARRPDLDDGEGIPMIQSDK